MKVYPVKSYNGAEYFDSILSFSGKSGSIELTYEAGDIKIRVEEVFPFVALIKIRLQLEQSGIRILCNGSRIDVYPSAAASESLKAYELEIGQPGTRERLRNIFEPANDLDKIATVREQELYWHKWLEASGLK